MAVDRLGNTVVAGALYALAGRVRRVSTDDVLIVLGEDSQHAIRCLAGDIVRVDDTTSGGGGATAHASLTGLSADDHPQYTLANGTRAFSAVVSGVDPTLSAHLATKGYVDFADGVVMSTVAAAAAATYQPLNQILSNLSSFLPSTADRLVYFIDTVGGLAQTAFTAAARTVLDDTTVAAMVDTLGGASSTGSGGLVRATSPTLVTPALGTPASGNLANCTGYPTIAVTAGGTGRATSTTAYGLLAAGTTATGVHQTLAAGATTEILVGGGASALPVWTSCTGTGKPARENSPVFTTPNIGTPSAGTLTNCTGLPTAGLVNSAVTYAKVQNVSATDKLLGRSTAGAGVVEEIACTAAGRALIDDTTSAAQRTTLGLVIGTDVHAQSATLDALDALLADGHSYIFCTDGSSGTVQAIDFTSAVAGDLLAYDPTASPPWVPQAPRSIVVQIAGALGGTVTFTNLPAAHTAWSHAFTRRMDLTSYRQVRLHCVQNTAAFSGSRLRLRYATTFTFVAASYNMLGTSEVDLALGTTGSTVHISSSWIDLASGAKADVYITPTALDGDGIADPQFQSVYAEFR